MTKLSKIFDIYTKQAELIFEKTDLLLQKDDAFRNLGETGYQVENFVRETLRGNPPDKPKAPEVEFSTKEVLREEVEIYG